MKYALILMLATTAIAQEPTLTSLAQANRYPITFDRNSISGLGADWILRESAGVQFVAIGEEHNVAEIPQFTAALFRALHDRYGFNDFADEQDPWMCGEVSLPPLRGNYERIAALHRKYPNAFTFEGDEEMQMLADIGRISTAKSRPIWGLDQLFGALDILEALLPMAPTDAARARTRELIAVVRPYEEKRYTETAHYMTDVGKTEDIIALERLYDPKPGSEAELLLDQLALSMRVYANYQLAAKQKQPTGYESNREREENMKTLFMRNYRAAEQIDRALPKVLLKFGHWHLYRGMSRGSVFTLGNFVSEFAKSNAMRSFSIAFLLDDGPGSNRDLLKWAPWTKPFVDASAGEWTVVDLRPMRPYAHASRLGTIDPELWRLLFGFDAVLLGRGAHKATIENAPAR